MLVEQSCGGGVQAGVVVQVGFDVLGQDRSGRFALDAVARSSQPSEGAEGSEGGGAVN
ncbi:hypothetical protein [Quadrisphaera sp. DSM 44207]|uniref:hypothetical protein n=1 Tax=Quadrisphaera sp. DSM 44207 TaxID=1881057 RepID=UPI0015A2FDEF|nr:hypothetical protein [Quadrisphaera sp. DSM 44207]